MGGVGGLFKSAVAGRNKGQAISGEALMERATSERGVTPPDDTRIPSMSDEQIRNAILAERSRLLAGNSRKAAFAVRGQSTSYLGG